MDDENSEINAVSVQHADQLGITVTTDKAACAPNDELTNQGEVYTVDDIGVTLDYEPSLAGDIEYNPDDTAENEERPSDGRSARTSREERACRRRQLRDRRRDIGFATFYLKHWFGQCVAAFLTGLTFLSIGIVFVSTGLSRYVGILFMVVSLPAFFMAVNTIRNRRRHERAMRENQNRREERRARRRRREEDAYRNNELPYSDLPPAYDNLGFEGNREDVERNSDSQSTSSSLSASSSSSSSSSSITDLPPSYEISRDMGKIKGYEETCTQEENEDVDENAVAREISNVHSPHCSHTAG